MPSKVYSLDGRHVSGLSPEDAVILPFTQRLLFDESGSRTPGIERCDREADGRIDKGIQRNVIGSLYVCKLIRDPADS